jgi:hypothetical protein
MTCLETIRAARVQMATELELLDPAARVTAAYHAVIDTGGTFVPNRASGTWGPHYAELKLLDVSHSGTTDAEAVANWIKAVHRIESDPMIGAAALSAQGPLA